MSRDLDLQQRQAREVRRACHRFQERSRRAAAQSDRLMPHLSALTEHAKTTSQPGSVVDHLQAMQKVLEPFLGRQGDRTPLASRSFPHPAPAIPQEKHYDRSRATSAPPDLGTFPYASRAQLHRACDTTMDNEMPDEQSSARCPPPMDPPNEEPRHSEAGRVIQSSQATEVELDLVAESELRNELERPRSHPDQTNLDVRKDTATTPCRIDISEIRNQTVNLPIKVKLEPQSQSQPFSASLRPPRLIESMDLDDMTQIIRTPNKTRRLMSLRPAAVSQLHYPRAQSLPSEDTSPGMDTPAAARLESSGAPVLPAQRIDSRTAGSQSHGISTPERRPNVPSGDTTVVPANHSTAFSRLQALLDESTPKKRTAADTGPQQVLRRPKRRIVSSESRQPHAEGFGQEPAHKKRKAPTPAPVPTKTESLEQDMLPAPKSLQKQEPQARPSNHAASNLRPQPMPAPKQTPLRQRPINTLCLSDFKVNPEMNDHQSHAFTETVRRREDKRCLPGCTDPRCCGDHFRRMAVLGVPTPHSGALGRLDDTPTRSNPLLSGIDNEQDAALLEEHFGSGFQARQRLEKMSATERRAALVQAKGDILAQRHGRHRERFQKEPSPTAFWDVEFPNTQENMRNKAEALAADRAKVEARYNEALKGRSGKARFIFRDE